MSGSSSNDQDPVADSDVVGVDYYTPEEMAAYQRMQERIDQHLLEMGAIDRIMDDPAQEKGAATSR